MGTDLFIRESALNTTRFVLAMFCVGVALQLAASLPHMVTYLKTRSPDDRAEEPPQLLGFIRVPMLGPSSFIGVGCVLILSLLIVPLGVYPRVVAAFALVAYVVFFGQILDLSYIAKKTNMIPVTLIVLLFGPGIDRPWSQATPVWPLELLKLLVGIVYLASAVAKLRTAGLRWADGRALQGHLVSNYLWSDRAPALALARHPSMCRIVSCLTLAWELTFWIIVFVPWLTPIYLLIGVGFHLSTYVTMRIDYLKFWKFNYLVFLPHESIDWLIRLCGLAG